MADTLSKLAKPAGATRKKTRRGRGVGSGLGKTAGRGQKGQFARADGFKPHFEGGQTPMQRRLPKRGFTNPFPVKTAEVNVGSLEVFSAGASVDEKALRDRGLVKGRCDRIKILGDGTLSKAMTVSAHSFSKVAAEKIAKAGGKAELVAPKVAASTPTPAGAPKASAAHPKAKA
jgi:large subunit ribosomal protein L15